MRAYDEVHISEEALANCHVAAAADPCHEQPNEHVRYTDIHGTAASDVHPNNPVSPTDDSSRNDEEEDTCVETKC